MLGVDEIEGAALVLQLRVAALFQRLPADGYLSAEMVTRLKAAVRVAQTLTPS